MESTDLQVTDLKRRALAGDLEALHALRERGFFRPQAAERGYPASRAQRRMWLSEGKRREGNAHAISLALRLRGPLDREALGRALGVLHARHESLRTRFAVRDGELRQFVDAAGDTPLVALDLRPSADPESECRALLNEKVRAPFDLSLSPLWRAYLCRLADDDHVLALVIHHIVADAWSLEVLKGELATIYQAQRDGRAPALPHLAQQYRDYAAAQYGREADERIARDADYWREKLASPPPHARLPFDFAKDGGAQRSGATLRVRWDSARLGALNECAARHNATLFIALQALVKALLQRYSGQTDLVIGTPFAGRGRPHLEGQVGLFINLLALRDRVEPAEGFGPLLERSARTAYEAYAHGDYPFDELTEEMAKARDGRTAEPFNVLVALQNVGAANAPLDSLAVEEFPLGVTVANYDLTFEFAEHGDSLLLLLNYDSDLFAPATVERMCGHLDRLAAAALADPARPIRELPLLTAEESAQLAAWNRTETDYPRRQTVAELFAARVEATPEATAVEYAGGRMTYRELDERADALARHIASRFESRGSRAAGRTVGLCLDRSPELVVAMLAALKAGAAYLPLDADLPAERLAFMIEDAGASLLVTRAELAGRLNGLAAEVVCADDPALLRLAPEPVVCAADAESVAYVMYTSGSTGRPKGVCVPHRAINRLALETDYVRLGAGDRVAQAATAAFDAATFEIWGALLNGATVCLFAREELLDPSLFVRLLRERAINVLFLTTALFNRLAQFDPAMFAPLDHLLFGGEAVDPRWVAAVLEHGRPRRLLHVYGPTESTTFSTWHEIDRVADGAQTVPIGRPLANTTAHVLDANRQPVPVGVAGELYVGGDGLAHGYLSRPDLTAERFVPDPFSQRPGARLYRTGDLVRRRADGAMEFIGRIDSQLKLRGYRIEPGEVEAALSAHADVLAAAVVARTSAAGDVQLVAYAAARPGSGLRASELRAHARTRLPAYMTPAHFVVLPELPLNDNGKVDRARLPEPFEGEPGAGDDYVAARTPTEEMLAGVWAEVLRLERVGAEDDFFERGGHSLMAMQVLSRLRDNFQIELPLHALFELPRLCDLAARIDSTRREGDALPPLVPRDEADEAEELPLSFAQQRLWFLAQLPSGAGATYSINAAFRLASRPRVAALRAALLKLTARQQSLRMNFTARDGRAAVLLREPYDPLAVRELSFASEAERESVFRDLAAEHARRPYDLERDELLRVTLAGADDGGEWLLLFGLHHIIADGWSLGLLAAELSALYEAAIEGRDAELAPLRLQYTDYAAWQRAWLRGDALERQLDYWRAQLGDAPRLLELPADRQRPAVQSFAGARLTRTLGAEVSTATRTLARREGATLFMTLLAAFKALLWRYTGQSDLVVGSPVANRGHSELESLVGFFVNTLALRTRLDPSVGFDTLLREVRRVCLDAYAHQDVPFERLVEEFRPERSLSYTPLFQVMLALENSPAGEFRLAGAGARPLEQETGTAKSDLVVSFSEHGGELVGAWEYSTDLFDEETVARMADHFAALLGAAASAPARAVCDLPLLAEAERRRLLVEWNETATDYPRDATIQQLFEAQAAAAPDRVALSFGGGRMTYGELNARANRLARRLRRLGVGPESPVAVCVGRGPELIVSVLATLKAGGAYVPLDPSYPAERLAFMLEDSRAQVFLTQRRLSDALPAHEARVVRVDEDRDEIAREESDDFDAGTCADNLAYVIYTSGSTGRPKGVCVTHRAVARLVCNSDYVQLSPEDVVAQASNASFDAATFEIWGALLSGARLAIITKDDLLDPHILAATLRREGVSTLFVTTALFNLIASEVPTGFDSLKHLLFGGEACDPKAVRAVLREGTPERLLHVYGPTESTTFSTWHAVGHVAEQATTIPIGRPISNTRAYVLDENLRPVPVGVAGELYLGGDGLARGYLGRPDLTAERFVPDPFSAEPGARLYRTGDLCRWLAGGAVEFLGRLDSQVKLRGFRVEPGEVEAALRREPGVREALVAVHGEGEHRQLVAYLVGTLTADELDAIRRSLRAQLPDYMIPAHLVAVEELPLNANGKVDRARLPAPDELAAARPYEPPADERERMLASIWSEVLGVERVGRDDNFFSLGGDSILSIQIVARARAAGLQFAVKDLFRHQTIAELARHAREAEAREAETAEAGRPVPLTPIQRWFFDLELEEPWHFNQSVMLRPRRELSEGALRTALAAVLAQHAAFRLRFRREGDVFAQSYADDADSLPLHVEDLRDLPEDEHRARLRERADAWQRSLDLSAGPLARVVLFHTSGGQRLLWCVHHLAIDAVSWRILLGDLQAALEAALEGRVPLLPPATAPFGAWADYLEALARAPRLAEEATYWEGSGGPTAAPPPDFPEGDPVLESTAHVGVRLDADLTRTLLEDVHAAYNLRANDVLLAALALALSSRTGRRECVVELEGHGRAERDGAPDVSRTVGWFTTLYPVRLSLPEDDDPASCLKAIKEQLRAVPSDGLAYGLLRRDGAGKPGLARAGVAFNYLGQFDQSVRDGLFDFAPEGAGENHTRRGRRHRLLDVDAWVSGGELQVTWGYSTNQYREETVRQLADDFAAALRALVAHCRAPASAGYTPSDFPLARLTQPQLDALALRRGRNVADAYPLSPMQQGMVFHSLYEGAGGGAYFEQLHCLVEGQLDAARMRLAWAELIRRHPVLRTAFQTDLHPPVQFVYREVELPWQEHDWRSVDEAGQQRLLEELLAEERRRGFDLSEPPLMRCHLARLRDESYRFVWCFHHLLLDGWSLPILFEELFGLLAHPSAAPTPRPPFRDYVAWLARQGDDAAARHWRDYLAGFDAPTPLPATRQPSAARDGGPYAEAHFTLDAAASARVRRFAQDERLTLNTLLQGAWALLLQRYTGEPDVIFGVTVSGRDIDLPGVERMLGLLINTVPLRVRAADVPVREWLREVQAAHQSNMAHAHTPLNEIQRYGSVPAGAPLINTLVVFENYPVEMRLPEGTRAGLRFADVSAVDHTSYPLTVVGASAGDALRFRIGYDTQLFDGEDIRRLFGHLRTLLEGISESAPECRPADLSMIDADEERQLFDRGRARRDAPAPRTLVELFAAQAERNPDRIAVVCDGRRLTYGELSARAKRLAGRLRRLGARPDSLVGLYASRSLDLVVGILGILEAGAAYLPLDPEVPPARLAFMLKDAGVVALLTQRDLADELPASSAPRLYLDDLDEPADEDDDDRAAPPEPHHLAYVIYTSGSTGQPKGVMITHANVTRLFDTTQEQCRFTEDDVWTLFHSYAFDFSVWELWGALLYGGRLVVVPHAVSRDVEAFYALLEAEGVTVLNQTPSAFRQLIPVAEQAQGRLALRLVIFGGEALELPALRPWFALYGDEQPRLVNMYGITETTVHVTWCPLREADAESTASLIGRPLADLDLFLLDAAGRPVPVGVAGEIYVGGAGLARGYLNRPALTEERFVDATVFGRRQRLYRSGDLARWRADGGLEYLGRVDHQIKLRGFRIELGEIESTLCQHPDVREAVVVPRGAAEQQTLAAYVVAARAEPPLAELRDWLAERLPDYMVPAHFVALDRLPLTTNGKVNRRALPEPTEADLGGGASFVAPRDEVERRLAHIWQEVLGVDAVGVEHNFFALGGHSLTAMQAVSRIHQTLGVKLPLKSLFEHPTIETLAPLVGAGGEADQAAIPPAPPADDYPLSHAEVRLWLDHQAAGASNYNMPEAFLFADGLDVEALRRALARVVERHGILRTAYVLVNGEPRKRILERLDIPVREVDLAGSERCEARTQEIIDEEAQAPFDLDRPPLLRVTLIRQPDSAYVLVMVMHHIVGDGWSRNVFHRELSALYSAYSEGRPDPLAPLPVQYNDYAVWEAARGFDREERYWREKLSGAPTRVSLPYDFTTTAAGRHRGDRRFIILNPVVTRGLRDVAARHNTSLSSVVLALFKLLLFRVSGQSDLCVGTIFANRPRPELEKLIGCFVNVLPVRTKLSADMEFDQLLAQVAASAYEALEHQTYPFDVLVSRLDRAGGPLARPFLDVIYDYQSAGNVRVDVGAKLTPGDGGGPSQELDFSFEFAKAELCLNVAEQGPDGLCLTLEYNSDLFRPETIDKYLGTLEQFAKSIAVIPQSGR